MRTLANYKAAYKKAAKSATKQRIFNQAMLNLSYADTQKFIEWQVNFMNNN
jgi:hypothetical protein